MYMPNGKRRIRLEPIRAMWQKHVASKDHRAVMKAADLAAARHVSPMIFTTIDQVTRVLECALAARQALTLCHLAGARYMDVFNLRSDETILRKAGKRDLVLTVA